MLDTWAIILIVLIVLAAIFVIIFARQRKPSILDFTFEHTENISIGKDHKELLDKVQAHRIEHGKTPLLLDDYMIMLARSRTARSRTRYLIDNDITIKLHKNFLKHRQSYMDMGLDLISENVSYGYRNVFDQWVKSEVHNENMLYDDWTFVGLSIEENHLGKKYVSLILAKL